MTLFPLSGAGEEEDVAIVISGEGTVEPDSYWKKRKEAFLRGSTVSLGDKFSSGTICDAFTRIICLDCFALLLENLLSYKLC